MFAQPGGYRVNRGALSDKTRPYCCLGNTVVAAVIQQLNLVRSRLDRSSFCVRRFRKKRFHHSDVRKKELIAAGSSQLAGLEKDPDFRRRSVLVVGENLHNHRNLMWGIAFE